MGAGPSYARGMLGAPPATSNEVPTTISPTRARTPLASAGLVQGLAVSEVYGNLQQGTRRNDTGQRILAFRLLATTPEHEETWLERAIGRARNVDPVPFETRYPVQDAGRQVEAAGATETSAEQLVVLRTRA